MHKAVEHCPDCAANEMMLKQVCEERDILRRRATKAELEVVDLWRKERMLLEAAAIARGFTEDRIRERDELQAWKESAMAVEREWNEQEIAKLLGGTPGQSCRKIIQKRVPEILSEINQLKAQIHDICHLAIAGLEAAGVGKMPMKGSPVS